ncbi:hypothetical protein APICC_03801 [Apis cerana cerana]|uniref:Uncharacterized protein n=1 Tax=Apis cerana cerana TaxID=94128 RepID=A0A2A3EB15_APICC|nr:hypothetical protein APICC_03801 [Apis cerana cerana]
MTSKAPRARFSTEANNRAVVAMARLALKASDDVSDGHLLTQHSRIVAARNGYRLHNDGYPLVEENTPCTGLFARETYGGMSRGQVRIETSWPVSKSLSRFWTCVPRPKNRPSMNILTPECHKSSGSGRVGIPKVCKITCYFGYPKL